MEKVIKKQKKISSKTFTIWDTSIQFGDKEETWEQISINAADKSVMILPLTDTGKIILIKKFCPASNTYEIVLPGGKVEGGLSVIQSARKELIEEIGFGSKKLISLGSLQILPSYLCAETFGYVATDLYKDSSLKGDEVEVLKVMTLSFKEALRLIKSNKINDARTIALILKYSTFFHSKDV